MQLKWLNMATARIPILVILTLFPGWTAAKFWTSQHSNECCWTDFIAGITRELSSELHCGFFCVQNSYDSFKFDNGLCHLSTATMPRVNQALFSPWKKKGETREVARGKPAVGSTPYSTEYPKRSVDGDTGTLYHSAEKTSQPWIYIDLQHNVWVSKVRILLHTVDPYQRRTVDIQTLLGTAPPPAENDFSQYTEVGFIPTALAAGESWQEYEVSPPLCSRYVAVKKKVPLDYDINLIQLYEVEVFAEF